MKIPNTTNTTFRLVILPAIALNLAVLWLTRDQLAGFARTHRVRPHRHMMTGLVGGGLFIAGAFTFVPGRLMWRVFF